MCVKRPVDKKGVEYCIQQGNARKIYPSQTINKVFFRVDQEHISFLVDLENFCQYYFYLVSTYNLSFSALISDQAPSIPPIPFSLTLLLWFNNGRFAHPVANGHLTCPADSQPPFPYYSVIFSPATHQAYGILVEQWQTAPSTTP